MTHKLHPDIQLGTVKLKVSDLERSLRFYREIVGFQILRQDARTAELTADGRSALLALEAIPDAVVTPPGTASGLYHFALLLPSRKDLGTALRRLIESGIRIGQADHLVSEALYISDPDHHGIEIYRDRPREDWRYDAAGQVMMATERIDWDGLLEESRGTVWSGLPPMTTMGHVHFHVGDLQKSKAFYSDLLGFDVQADYMKQMGALFLGAGGYHHHIGLNIWAGVGAPPPPPNGTSIAYFTIVVPNGAELEATLRRLESAGISAEKQGGARVVADPSGIALRLVAAQS